MSTGRRRWWAVGALAVSGLVIGIDATVLSLALPNLATDLHASTSDLQWFLDGYLIVLGALMLPAGLLGDRFGRKRLLLGALALFGVGSFACAYAGSPGQLIAARVVLGLAAAFVMPLAFSVLPVLFEEHERQRALAVVAGSAILAFPIGPVLGGWLLNRFWWGSVFLINIPVVVLALVVVAVALPESRASREDGRRPGFDPVGVLLSTAGLVGLTYGVIKAGERGWGDVAAIGWIAGGALVVVGFIGWEHRVGRAGREPVVDLRLFRSASFSWGTALSTLMQFAMIGLLFAVPQYFRAVLGTDAMGAGVRLLPLIGGLVVGLGAGDRLSRKVGANLTVGLGFLVMAAGMLTAASTGSASGTGFAATWLAIGGLGMGAVMPSALNAALSRLDKQSSGVGSAVISAIRQVGGTFGVAVLGSVLSSAYRGRLELTGLPAPVRAAVRDSVNSGVAAARQVGSPQLLNTVRLAYVHGMDVMLAVSAGIALVSAVLGVVFLPGRRAAADPQPGRQAAPDDALVP
ncbi:MAG: MFS transporter [Micromonosporaceae bacterium]|nr:MFS transporter [Micromonosporaceae bacterium]